MKKIVLLFLSLGLTMSSLMAEVTTTTTTTDTAGQTADETMPIISEKKLKSAAQVTIGYAISEGKKKNSAGEVSW